MSGPWEDFATTAEAGPWVDFAKPFEQPKKTRDYGNPNIGIGEAALAIGSGMIAKPASDVIGLARLGMEGLRRAGVSFIDKRDPLTVKEDVQRAMTYEPRTEIGKAVSEYNPIALIGKGVNWLADKAGSFVAGDESSPVRNALGSGVHETVNQLPTFLGMKAPAAAAATKGAIMGAEGGGAGMFTARGMMQGAMKPSSKDLLTGKAGRAIDTMLDEGLNVSKGGVETMRDRVFALNNEIKDRIANSPAVISQPGVMAQVNREMNGLLNRFYKQATYTTDIAAIQKAWDEVVNHPMLQGPDIPVQLAQEIKQGTYKSLGDKAYPGGQVAGGAAAEKAVARIMKEEVANAVPEVRPLNAQESKYLNVLSVVEKKALMEANKNLIGMGWLSTNPVHMAAWMADRSSLFKSLVARMLSSSAKAIPEMNIAGPVAGVATTDEADKQR